VGVSQRVPTDRRWRCNHCREQLAAPPSRRLGARVRGEAPRGYPCNRRGAPGSDEHRLKPSPGGQSPVCAAAQFRRVVHARVVVVRPQSHASTITSRQRETGSAYEQLVIAPSEWAEAGDLGHPVAAQTHTGSMTKYRNYWVYSIGCFVVWGVILAVMALQGKSGKTHTVLLVFGGWVIAWVSGTIARFVYPPPSRWLPSRTPAPDE
jgi:hypothetical protein